MGLEDNKDLRARGDERANRSVDITRFTVDSGWRTDMLSEIWHELLGAQPLETLAESDPSDPVEGGVTSDVPVEPSSLSVDPWSELLHVQGVEVVDLQQPEFPIAHVALSEVEVEEALQILQEQTVEEMARGSREKEARRPGRQGDGKGK
ncbi:MAG TPA: hypothetical protein VEL69_01460 [Ktedonobacteraceae bacterium]|nr:hypothetical protein [Ktedonobacteraceae bacterium]